MKAEHAPTGTESTMQACTSAVSGEACLDEYSNRHQLVGLCLLRSVPIAQTAQQLQTRTTRIAMRGNQRFAAPPGGQK